ncbi:MDR family MFS transporter [Gordonia sp. (in: high G+C Gram-positive bacteria)]|uniref:MDR family MFS transporter n=1 Tax=Gordonia sp. (in: high G+C Gram-positive bacteria) TaxID=84139 RepID=UPI0025C6057D|nr:MDR family MFS transporter [Gordonia sp. (in: high G+C Gram-positive bacteria)]
MSTNAPTTPAPGSDDQAPVQMDKKVVYLIFGSLVAAMFLSSLDQSVVGTALPTIVGDLNAVSHEGWIVTSYLVAIAIVMPVYGKVGDLFGRRWPFLIAIAIFLCGSLGSALSTSFAELVIFRSLQGLGAGGLMILSQAIIADITSARDRGKYMGPMGAIFGVAAVLGPLLGGWFAQGPGWRWCFWLNVPVALTALIISFFALKLPMKHVKKKFDFLGTLFLALATTGIVLVTSWTSIVSGGKYDWSNPWLLGLLIGSIVSLILFIVVELKVEEPLIPLRLFKDSVFSVSVAVAFVVGMTMFAALAYLPTFLQMARDVDPTDSGLLMLPMTIGLMITAVGSGLMITKTGKYRIYPILGMAVTAVGIGWMTQITANMSMILFGAMIFVLGFGMGLVIQTIVIAVQNAVSPSEVGTATSTNNFLREIGAAVGTSVFGTVFTSKLTEKLTDIKSDFPSAGASVDDAAGLTPDKVGALKDVDPEAYNAIVDAYASAMAPSFWYLLPVAIIGFVLSLFLRDRTLSTTSGFEAQSQAEQTAAAKAAVSAVDGVDDPMSELDDDRDDEVGAGTPV